MADMKIICSYSKSYKLHNTKDISSVPNRFENETRPNRSEAELLVEVDDGVEVVCEEL